jgi:hypothetical protein
MPSNALRGKAVTGCMNYVLFKKLAAITVIPPSEWEARWRLRMRL